MRPDLPWNVAGVPPEAREAARAAARREGLSVGEWLTRRILRSLADQQQPRPDDNTSEDWNEPVLNRPPQRREGDEEFSRRAFDAEGACRRIEDDLRGVTHRLDAAERSQSDSHRALNKTTTEVSATNREHARAVDELAHRIERVERQTPTEGLRDAVRGLHQGLTRLADQLAHASAHSTDQISGLTSRLEEVSARLSHTKLETDAVVRRLEGRAAQIDDRMHALDRRIEANASEATHAAENALAVARLEESLAKVEARARDPALDRRLSTIERTLANVTDRGPAADPQVAIVEERLRLLAERIESSEKQQREIASELREAIAAIPPSVAHDALVPVAPQIDTHEPPAPAATQVDAHEPPAVTAAELEVQSTSQSMEILPHPEDVFPHNAPRPPEAAEGLADVFAAVEAAPTPVDEQTQGPTPGDAPSPLHDSFLAAARRSALQAAAQAEAERTSRGFTGFAWSTRAEPERRSPSRYGVIGAAALAIVVLAVAGVWLSHRLAMNVSPTGGTSTLIAVRGMPTTKSPRVRPASASASATLRASPPQSGPAPGVRKPTSPPTTGAANSHSAPPHHDGLASVDARDANSAGIASSQPAVAATPSPARPAPSPAALDRLTALANLGNAKAEMIVGLRYLDGEGTPPNESEAAKWLARAAEHGEAVAQYRLGTLYEHGHGVPADPAKAIHWYEAAAQAGNRKAMHNLAVAYAQGAGASKDFFEAARWFSKAAALGLADSQFNLAVLYERGLGVPQSLIDAYKWYAIAAAQGDSESKVRIDAIATQLSADDRAAAQRAAEQFRPAQLNATANVPPQLNDIAG